jgi:hypothetical protein
MHSIFPEMELTPSEIPSWENKPAIRKRGPFAFINCPFVADAAKNSQSFETMRCENCRHLGQMAGQDTIPDHLGPRLWLGSVRTYASDVATREPDAKPGGEKSGVGNGNRTRNRRSHSPVLCQLSYSHRHADYSNRSSGLSF